MTQALLRGGVALQVQRLALDFEMRDAAVLPIEFDGHGADLQAQGGAGFVDQIDGLVGQEAVGDIALGKQGGRDDGRVLNAHAVMDFEFLLQPAQDRDGIIHGGLANQDGLEAARQGGVFFHAFVFDQAWWRRYSAARRAPAPA